MSKKAKKGWEGYTIYTRVKLRKYYPTGPRSGKGIWQKYVAYFKQTLKEIKPKTVLVLGSTPELRDLVLKHHLNLITVDFSNANVKTMNRIMKYRNSPKEKIIVSDWLKIKLKKGAVDFVLGDGITNNIKSNLHQKFFKKVQGLLRPGGRILLRDVIRDKTKLYRRPEEIIIKAHKDKWHPFDLFLYMYVYNSVSNDKKSGISDMGILRKYLEKNVYPKAFLSPKEKSICKSFINSDIKHTFIAEKDWLLNFKRYFRLLDVGKASGYRFCNYFKFYYGEKK